MHDRESVMITPYIDRDEEIEEVPKEVKIAGILISRDEGPHVRDKKEKSYQDREETRHESRIVETSCEFTEFVCAFTTILDRIKDRVRDNIEIKGGEEYLKKIDAHF